MVNELTVGNPRKILIKFCLPMILSVCVQQMYNFADSIVIGKFYSSDPEVSTRAVAAVGSSSGSIIFVLMAIAIGANAGCSVLISQYFGAANYKKMNLAINTSIVSILSLSVVLMGVYFIFSKQIFAFLNTPENILADSLTYLNIYIASLVFLFLYNITNGIFTALGDSRTPMYFLIFSSVLNIVLDLVFVIVFGFGIAGVAWATFIAQTLAGILSFAALIKRLKQFRKGEKQTYFSFSMLKKLSNFAVPGILQQSFVSVGNFYIQKTINDYGEFIAAGFTVAFRLNTLALLIFMTVSSGLSAFTAQNVGAGKYERIKPGLRAGLLLMIFLVIPFIIVYILFAPQLAQIFLDADSEVSINTAAEFLRGISPFYLIIMIKLLIDGILRGTGAMKFFMLSTVIDLIIRVILSNGLNKHFAYSGVMYAWIVGWIVAAGLSLIFYFKRVWAKNIEITPAV